ncbi:MAG: hypothetical protein QNJ88_02675 [Acidimicrobiia bacterium]|nr:hypothetical protein [Acidimicrobiia bacterium]
MSATLAYVAAAVIALWGIAHAIPTRQVVAGFGAISTDNRRIITQEWIAEALTMWFLAALIVLVTAFGDTGTIAPWIYRSVAIMLVAVGALTAATGGRTPVIWFKICPVLLTSTAILLIIASVV